MSEREELPVHAVLYTDGGYRAEYQAGGWAIHGYTYTAVPPTKGTGNPKCMPTAKGYVTEKGKGEPVTLLNYIDGVGGVAPAESSNHTELVATIKGLELCVEKRYSHVQIMTDSMYVVNGLNKWVNKWNKIGWVNAEGQSVKNKDLWLNAMSLMQKVREQSRYLEILWVKGHSGDFGNEMADGLAKRGNVLGYKGSPYTFLKETPAAGYWNKKASFNRLLSNGRWYFQTTDTEYLTASGESIYYIGDHGADDDLCGKRIADNSAAVLYLKEPDPVLETLRKQAIELDTRHFGSVMVGRLDTILNPTFYTEVLEHGTLFLQWPNHKKDVLTASKKPVLKEMSPPGLAYVQIDVLNSLQKRLDSFLAKEPHVVVTEITDLLYDVEAKKAGPVKKVKKELTQSTRYLDVKARYSTAFSSVITGPDDPSIQEKSIRLILGMDLAKRNTLSNVANDDVTVYVVTWRESDQVIRFATIIKTSHAVGIWAGIDANYLMV